MKRFYLAFPLIGILFGSPSSAAPRLQYTPPGSFLKYRAATVNELVYQANTVKDVRLKYARHFGVAPERVPPYFRTLKLTALKSPTRLQSWHYDKAGRYRSNTVSLPKGTLVFAGMDGKPVLSWSCGNPLSKPNVELALKQYEETRKKPAVVAAKTAEKPAVVAVRPESKTDEPIETKVLADTPEIVMAPPAELPAVDPAALATLPEVAAPPLPAPQVVAQLPDIVAAPAAAAAAEAATGAVSSGLGALPYLGGLAGLVGGIMLAGGGGDDAPPSPIPPVAVPEPSSAAALAAGLVGLLVMRRRRTA